VAVKKLVIVEDEDFEEIMKEIDIMKDCDSPYIVTYYGSYWRREENEMWVSRFYTYKIVFILTQIIMEYCSGGSITDMLAKIKHPLNEDQISAVCECTLKGLEYLHASGKIHRDIKPDNILVNSVGEAKLGKEIVFFFIFLICL